MRLYLRVRLAHACLSWSLRLYGLGQVLVRWSRRLDPPDVEPQGVNLIALSEPHYRDAVQAYVRTRVLQPDLAQEIARPRSRA